MAPRPSCNRSVTDVPSRCLGESPMKIRTRETPGAATSTFHVPSAVPAVTVAESNGICADARLRGPETAGATGCVLAGAAVTGMEAVAPAAAVTPPAAQRATELPESLCMTGKPKLNVAT
jgi:hypothetical protein